MRKILLAAAAALEMVAATTPASATTYSFTAGPDNGTFTTGGSDPILTGYDTLTGLTFDTIFLDDAEYHDLDFDYGVPGDAYNPLINQFGTDIYFGIYPGIYPYSGGTSAFIPGTDLGQAIFSVGFQVGSPISGTYRLGDCEVTSNCGSIEPPQPFTVIGVVSAAPEPSTWALLLTGLAGIRLAFRQARRRHGLRWRDALAV